MAHLGNPWRTLRVVVVGGRGRHRSASGRARPPLSAEERLRALGEQAPELPPEELHPLVQARLRRFAARATVRLLVGLAVAYVAVQWFRPLPAAVFEPATAGHVQLPGAPPSLPWPGQGSAAVTVAGTAVVLSHGSDRPVPVAGLAAVLTAYVVLRDHPLGAGPGPTLTVDGPTVAAMAQGDGAEQTELAVSAGQHLSERQVLDGLLVAGAGDMATLAADWDAGSVGAFVARENQVARRLGMTATTITDPAGASTTTVSTPADLVRLGAAAMGVPALAAIVAQGEVTLPSGGVAYNPDGLVGHDGFVGVKTGDDQAAGGCFLFAARGGPPATGGPALAVGAVLGQSGLSDLDASLAAAEPLARAALAGLRNDTVVTAGEVLGRLRTEWGTDLAVRAPRALTVTGWPSQPVTLRLSRPMLADSVASGSRVGRLVLSTGSGTQTLVLRAPRAVRPPGVTWRLGRL